MRSRAARPLAGFPSGWLRTDTSRANTSATQQWNSITSEKSRNETARQFLPTLESNRRILVGPRVSSPLNFGFVGRHKRRVCLLVLFRTAGLRICLSGRLILRGVKRSFPNVLRVFVFLPGEVLRV